MSKLAFKESEYFEDSDHGHNQGGVIHDDDSVHSSDNNYENDAVCTDSYSLFDLDPTNSKDSSAKKSRKKKRKHSSELVAPMEPASVVDSELEGQQAAADTGTDVSTEEVVTKSAKKKRKRRKVSTGGTFEEVHSNNHAPTGPAVSNFLAKFLGTKREAADVPPPPEIEEPNDSFLKQFHSDFAASSNSDSDGGDSDFDQAEEQSGDLSSIGSDTKLKKPKLDNSRRNDSTTSLYASTVEDDAPKNVVVLQFFNLPYRISVEQVSYTSWVFEYLFCGQFTVYGMTSSPRCS